VIYFACKDKDGTKKLSFEMPKRRAACISWYGTGYLDARTIDSFPDMEWADAPIKVRLTLEVVDND